MYAEQLEQQVLSGICNDTKTEAQLKEWEYYDRLHHEKYRDTHQSRHNHHCTLAKNLATNADHYMKLLPILQSNRFLPAGRIQAALGATEREVSPFNCSVSQPVGDSIDSIYNALTNAAKILRLGTGIGYNFSSIRPFRDLVVKLQSHASGPISYMGLYDCSAKLIASAGHRRGAQMGIMNISHPDIEAFIDAKMVKGQLESFNISVGITDNFMEAVRNNDNWNLVFNGKVYKTLSARYLWDKILKNAYESAEPGVVFLDTMNKQNNLFYCEEIEATNPCSEQPLPPYGLCTLGSFNLVDYIYEGGQGWTFNVDRFKHDISVVVEAYDNIFDNALYAIPEHRIDALNKRRIGLGLTGIANAIEMMVGKPSYGEPQFNRTLNIIAKMLQDEAYRASVKLAKERGPFPLFDPIQYLQSPYIKNLDADIQRDIELHGIRNSHLISYAPCGTISQIAGNISSGVEPVFYHTLSRSVFMKDGKEQLTLTDYVYREFGFKGKTLEECTVEQHMAVGEICQRYCDSAVSKTVNVAPNCTYEEYKGIFEKAYELGMKGITVYRPTELRGAVIVKAEDNEQITNTSELNTSSCASGACER